MRTLEEEQLGVWVGCGLCLQDPRTRLGEQLDQVWNAGERSRLEIKVRPQAPRGREAMAWGSHCQESVERGQGQGQPQRQMGQVAGRDEEATERRTGR